MKKIVFGTIVAALGVSALVMANQGQYQTQAQEKPEGQESPVRIGGPAPDFTLVDSNGKSHSLSDFKGNFVILEWTNHECPFVVKHYQGGHMQETQKWATGKGAIWLSIISSAPGKQGHLDGAGANRIREQQKHASTATLLDPTGKVGRLYGARTTPHMFIICPQGMIRYIGAIDSNRSSNPADIAGARNHVREALTELWAGKPVSVPSTQPYGCSVKYQD